MPTKTKTTLTKTVADLGATVSGQTGSRDTKTLDIDLAGDLGLKVIGEIGAKGIVNWPGAEGVATRTVGVPVGTTAQDADDVARAVPTIQTGQLWAVYMQETAFTNPAAELAEGEAFAEVTLSADLIRQRLRKIGVWLPITEELFEDDAAAETYVRDRLPFMARQRLSAQLLAGDGVAPNLQGIHATTGIGSITWDTAAADPAAASMAAAIEAAALCRTTGKASPNLVVIDADLWQGWIDAKNAGTAEAITFVGEQMFLAGMLVLTTGQQAANTIAVGDVRNHARLIMQPEVEVELSPTHSTFFAEDKVAARVWLRAWLAILRPSAFAEAVPAPTA